MIDTERTPETPFRRAARKGFRWCIAAGAVSVFLCSGYQKMEDYAVPPIFRGTSNVKYKETGATYTPIREGIEQKVAVTADEADIPEEILERLIQIRDDKKQVCNGFILTPDGLAGSAGHCLSNERGYSARHHGKDYPIVKVYWDDEMDLSIFKLGGFHWTGDGCPA